MSKRKTVSVDSVRARVNYLMDHMGEGSALPCYLKDRETGEALTPDQAYRLGAASVLESVLHSTGNYHGFGYLGCDYSTDPVTIPDETRRKYN